MSTRPPIYLYTDGAASGNPGPGGWGAVLKCGNLRREMSGGFAHTTNNRMELMAVIEGLKAIRWEHARVEVWSDSKYVVDALQKGWAQGWKKRGWIKSDKKPALNPDLWEELLELTCLHTVRCHWVKGHGDNPKNNRCDEMAVEQWKRLRQQP